MCRFIAYLGEDVLLKKILVDQVNSIVKQSLHARESSIPTNGDGFGLGWYTPHIDPTPALFTSISPAWNDRNLLNLTSKIISPCFFAHVRAASTGAVTSYNCHPFVNGKWMLMHNGGVGDFITVKRHMRHLLDDDIYHWIQGDTDSELIFALFLQLSKGRDISTLSVAGDVLQETLSITHDLVVRYNSKESSFFNICLTNGEQMIATRYCSDANAMPETLHYMNRDHLLRDNPDLNDTDKDYNFTVITSEKLTNFHVDWQEVPRNTLLLVDKSKQITLRPL
jgi:glutamine amidotransferase